MTDYTKLLSYAKISLEHGLIHDAPAFMDMDLVPEEFKVMAETFVTLKYKNENAGCIGNTDKPQHLFKSVMVNAYKSGFKDLRFAKMNRYRLDRSVMNISILTPVRQTLKNTSVREIVEQMKDNHTLHIYFNKTFSATMLSYVKHEFKSYEDFINATLDKSKIDRKMINLAKVTLIETETLPFTRYSDIQI